MCLQIMNAIVSLFHYITFTLRCNTVVSCGWLISIDERCSQSITLFRSLHLFPSTALFFIPFVRHFRSGMPVWVCSALTAWLPAGYLIARERKRKQNQRKAEKQINCTSKFIHWFHRFMLDFFISHMTFFNEAFIVGRNPLFFYMFSITIIIFIL